MFWRTGCWPGGTSPFRRGGRSGHPGCAEAALTIRDLARAELLPFRLTAKRGHQCGVDSAYRAWPGRHIAVMLLSHSTAAQQLLQYPTVRTQWHNCRFDDSLTFYRIQISLLPTTARRHRGAFIDLTHRNRVLGLRLALCHLEQRHRLRIVLSALRWRMKHHWQNRSAPFVNGDLFFIHFHLLDKLIHPLLQMLSAHLCFHQRFPCLQQIRFSTHLDD